MDSVIESQKKVEDSYLKNEVRDRALNLCKDFKTSWVHLGQILYAIYDDKTYQSWGFDKFEDYTKKDLGLQKSVATKMLKSYLFVETEEPAYLKKDFTLEREGPFVPSLEEINLLRMAKGKKELLNQDFHQLKKAVFEKGQDIGEVRRELTALMKERKPIDPDEEREKRTDSSIKKLIASLRMFQKDMDATKLVPYAVLEEAEDLMLKLNDVLSQPDQEVQSEGGEVDVEIVQ